MFNSSSVLSQKNSGTGTMWIWNGWRPGGRGLLIKKNDLPGLQYESHKWREILFAIFQTFARDTTLHRLIFI
jgi:hypothetical protein